VFAYNPKQMHKNFVSQIHPDLSKVYSPYIPDSVTFCGENVPLNDQIVREAIDYELIINMYRHSSTILYIKRANRYFPAIEKYLAQQNIPDDFKYLCVTESGLANVVSSAGAAGFWQIMEKTGKEYGLLINKNVDERYNPDLSMVAAVKYLKDAYKKFNNWTLAAASYNMGMAGLNKNIVDQAENSYWNLQLNDETTRYICRIVALKLILENPQSYGYHINNDELYQPIEFDELVVDSSINNLVNFAKNHGANYKTLKYYNTWIKRNDYSFPNDEERNFIFKIPKNI
jgi:hypothetical protein